MRRSLRIAGVVAMVVLGTWGFGQSNKGKGGAQEIVIVFKDGHRQSFNLADVARVEFSGATAVADASSAQPGTPPRGHFFGKWEVGDGAGNTFFITLKENGDAYRSLRDVHGKWAYVNGEARITWNDGAGCDSARGWQGQEGSLRGGQVVHRRAGQCDRCAEHKPTADLARIRSDPNQRQGFRNRSRAISVSRSEKHGWILSSLSRRCDQEIRSFVSRIPERENSCDLPHRAGWR